MQHWNEYIDSQVSGTYVIPMYPQKNEDVTLKIKITDNVEKVILFVRINGTYSSINCFLDNGFAQATINTLEMDEIHYYFALKVEDAYYYYSVLGLTQSLVCERDMFSLKTNIKPAGWVSSSTCYQIFPDRFRRGESEFEITDGLYDFDGGTVKKLNFDEKPLEFDQGRCLDFFGGNLQGIIDSVDHLKRLGITSVYLNPIGVSRTTHRYDCCDFFHIDEKLGGDEMFIKMVDVLHENNIKVIVDISINHTGIDHPWFKKASTDSNSEEATYYYIEEDGSVSFWEGVKTLPQLNYNSKKLRSLIYGDEESVMQKFLKEPFNQDGWRLDVAEVVGRKGTDQLTDEIWREVHSSIKGVREDAYLVGEAWNDATEYLQGDMWDGIMNYVGCGRPIRRWMGENDKFLLDNWGSNPGSTKPYSGVALKEALESNLNTLPSQMRYLQMNLFDSHDTPRLHNNIAVYNKDIYLSCVMLSYILPGMPSTYYGDEIGIDGKLNSVEMWRYPMQWDEDKWNKDIFDTYCKLGEIRNKYSSILSYGSTRFMKCDEKHMSLIRYVEDESILLIMNKDVSGIFEMELAPIVADEVTNLLGDAVCTIEEGKLRCSLKENESIVLHLKKND
ncbi:MAG: glycoside hydrolase family 13 protein [Sphaerochaeta sp.]